MSWWNRRTAPVIQLVGLAGLAALASRDVDRTMRANDVPVTKDQEQAIAHDLQARRWFGR